MSKDSDVRKQALDIYLKRCDEVDRLAADFEEEEVVDLLTRALQVGVESERSECLKIIENTAQGSLQANLALSLAYETIKKRGEVK